jgi:hypothetical protein
LQLIWVLISAAIDALDLEFEDLRTEVRIHQDSQVPLVVTSVSVDDLEALARDYGLLHEEEEVVVHDII